MALENAFEERDLRKPGISALPLVEGDLPSRGFIGLNPVTLVKDLKAGLIKNASNHIKKLKELSETATFMVCVGDIYPVVLASWFTNKPVIHLATAISARFRKYNILEINLFKKHCRVVFTRDSETADYLNNNGVNAKFLGNIMMDDPNLEEEESSLNINGDKKVIGLIPSSRQDAYENIEKLAGIAKLISEVEDIEFVLSTSPNIDPGKIKEKIAGSSIKLVQGSFGSLLRKSDLILGMTGTGNEQAVGLGTPVVLIEHGTAASKARIEQYQKLLGKSVVAPKGSDKEIAMEVLALLKNSEKLKEMSAEGKKLMGEPGAAKRIAESIIEVVQ